MVRGKRPCELGRDCPYKHEYQHSLEFSHPDNSAAGVKTKRFEGNARKLGGSRLPHPAPHQPERKKPRLAAKRAAADAALRRAAVVQTGPNPTPVSTASSSGGPLLPRSATLQNNQGTRPKNSAAVSKQLDATRLPTMQGSSQRTNAGSAVAVQPKKKAPMTREASSDDVIDLTGFD